MTKLWRAAVTPDPSGPEAALHRGDERVEHIPRLRLVKIIDRYLSERHKYHAEWPRPSNKKSFERSSLDEFTDDGVGPGEPWTGIAHGVIWIECLVGEEGTGM